MVVVAAVDVRRRLMPELKLLALYFVIALIITAIQVVLAFQTINNRWTGQVFTPIEFVMLMYVFQTWHRRSTAGKIMLYSIAAYVGFWGLGMLSLGSETYTYLDPLGSASLVLAASYTLFTLDRGEVSPVMSMPSFWVSSAALIYFGSTIVLLSLNTALLQASRTTLRLAWSVQAVVNIVANLAYAWGFLCLRRKT